MKSTPGKSSRRERGNALIEFALSFFLIFAMFAGIFRFGYSFYVYNTVVNAVRNGARYASIKPYDSITTTPSNAFASDVKKMVVYGDPNAANGARPVVPGLTTAHVQLTVTGSLAGSLTAPTAITVSINGFNIDAVFGSLNLDGKPKASFPYTGILTPL
jgi:Flp pilus assembly protein TadG